MTMNSVDRRLGPGVGDRERGMEKLTGNEVLDGLLIAGVLTIAVGKFAFFKASEKAATVATRIGRDLNKLSEDGMESARRDLRDALGGAKRISK